MKQLKLLFTVLFLAVLGLGNVWGADVTYKLSQVTSVSAGNKYVFIQDTHAFGSSVLSSALQTVTGYNTTGLAGTEAYVWTLETATGGFYMKNVSLQSNQYLNNSSSTGMSFGSKNSIWTFDFTDANAVLIQNKSNSSRFLGYTTATSYVYKAYATTNLSNYPHAIKVYVLEEETGSDPDPEPTKYTVTVADGIANGTVTASPTSAKEGDVVTLTATPSTGYEFGSWNVTNASTSAAITVTDNKFQMPAANVNVSATFNEIQAGRPENEIFYESFNTNDGTGGNDGSWSGSIASATIKQDNDGWVYEKGSGANKCAKFGTGSALGSATTPALGEACNATLTFKAAAWNGSSESTTLKLSVVGDGSISPATVTMDKGAWKDFEVTLTNLTADSKIKFEGNAASNSRFFLDEVSIVKTGAPTPVASFTVSPTSIDFGSKEQGATVDAQDVTVTLTNTDYAIATLSGTNAAAFEIVAGAELTETGVVSVRPTTAALAVAGTYTASLDIEADGVTDAKSVALSLTVTAPAAKHNVIWSVNGATSSVEVAEGEAIVFADPEAALIPDDVVFKGWTAAAIVGTQAEAPEYVTEATMGAEDVTYFAVFATEVEGEEVTILSEEFDNTTTSDASGAFNNGRFANFNGTTEKAYTSKDGGVKFGTSSAAGYITSKSLDLSKAFTVKVDIKKYGSDGGSIDVTVGDTKKSKTPSSADNYETATFTFAAATSTSTIKIGTSQKRAYIDNVVVTTAGESSYSDYCTSVVIKELTGIVVSGTAPELWKGDEFSHDGMTVTAKYSNAADEDVSADAAFSGYDMATAGAQTVTVTYNGKTATYEITVKTIANTQATAYTAAQAKALYDAGNDLSTPVYVKGIVSEIATAWNESYGNISFNVSADGTTDGDQFQFFRNFKGADKAKWTSTDMIPEVGDKVIGYGTMTYFAKNDIYEFAEGNYLVSLERPVVLTSIELNTDNVKKTYKIGSDDVFSAENLVVTAHYNVYSNDKTIDLSDVTISGYNMEVANNYTVTVSYTENEVTKTATYQIQVKPNCETLATITMGAADNGTFDLTVKGEQCAETAISTVLTATPATHYHLASVTATNGTVGAIEGNTCTISDITADAEITAVFEEDAKGTATFVAGAAEATGTAPAAITKYVGETLTVPANTFALAGHIFAGWKYNETIYQKDDEFTVVGDAEFVAQWEALPVWASTYTSNVTLAVNGQSNVYAENVKVDDVERTALRLSTGSNNGTAKITVPAGATALHFHSIAWKGDKATLTVKNGEVTLMDAQELTAYDGLSGSTKPYTIVGDMTQEYYCINFVPALTEETTLDFISVKRCAIFGVNYVAPAKVTLAPASHDFEEVKEGETAEFEFTATKNAFATGDIAVTFEGADAAAFSAGAVDAETGKFTVTFAPNEVRAYSATVKVTVDGAEATATLAGTGISATTPTISTDVETIDFGSVKQDASVAAQTVNVTLEYLDAATVAISGTVFTLDKTALSESGAITISANTAAMGTYTETLTISGVGATSKTVTVTMEVTSKYASEYTSNVEFSGDQKVTVKINEEEFDGAKANRGSVVTVTVPKGTTTLHFHAAAWKDEAQTITVSSTALAEAQTFDIVAEGDISGTKTTYTFAGDNYDTDQYFYVSLADVTEETTVTFTAATDKRFVLYGVNQEGGIVPVLDHIAIEGTATKLAYEVGNAFNPAGLSVKAYYTMEGVIDDSKTKTLAAADLEWSFSPATLTAGTESVEATATYEGLNATKTITGLTVTVPAPEIEVSATKLAFGIVELDETVEAKAVTVTLKNLAAANVAISGEGAAKFAADVTSLTESGDVTISVITDEAGTYAATLTISGEGAEDKTVALSMTVMAPDNCDGTDDFSTATSDNASSYNSRTTTDGWSATNAALTTIGDEKFLTINGKTIAVGVITSPVIANGLKDLKIRYVNKNSENNGAKFRVDVKVGDVVVYTETITRANEDMNKDEIYTAEFNNMKVLGDCQIVITNLSPSNSSSNKDRVSIGRICYTTYEGLTETRALNGMGTHCYPFTIEAGAYTGATFYQIAYKKSEVSIVWDEVLGDIEAGNPYLVVLNEGATELKYLPGATEAVDAQTVNGFVGSYTQEWIDANDGNYIIYNGQFRLAGVYVAVGANRAYIHLEGVDPTETQAPAGARRFVMHNADSQEVTTGMENAINNENVSKMLINGQLFIIRGEKMYNVEGQLVK